MGLIMNLTIFLRAWKLDFWPLLGVYPPGLALADYWSHLPGVYPPWFLIGAKSSSKGPRRTESSFKEPRSAESSSTGPHALTDTPTLLFFGYMHARAQTGRHAGPF